MRNDDLYTNSPPDCQDKGLAQCIVRDKIRGCDADFGLRLVGGNEQGIVQGIALLVRATGNKL